jgi:hypothetical protein
MIDMVAAKDLGQAEIAKVFDPERRYSHLTVVVAALKMKDSATQIEKFGAEGPGYLKLEEVREYRGLTVLSFRSARSTLHGGGVRSGQSRDSRWEFDRTVGCGLPRPA